MATLQPPLQTVEIPIQGMDCAECTRHVQQAIAALPGVKAVEVYLATEKARVTLDVAQVDLQAIQSAVERSGYRVPRSSYLSATRNLDRKLKMMLAIAFSGVFLLVVFGEGLGLFEKINAFLPAPLGLALVLALGSPVFVRVLRATVKRRITSHTLMSLGALAALYVQDWMAALIVILFMHVGAYIERFTTQQARQAIRALATLTPRLARVERDGEEIETSIEYVKEKEIVIVRPGERIPVDGIVLSGQATIDQSTITGEAMPVEAFAGCSVYAATLVKSGSLRIQTRRVGEDTTFGRIVHLVSEAEANRGEVQQLADRFSMYYLPLVASIAILTLLFSRNPLAAVAVLVVACSCSIALATPIAYLATIGVSAKRGIVVKGGKYIETLAQASVLLVDKTGTLTVGKPEITDILALDGMPAEELLTLAAAAERYSEHPLAEAVLEAAKARGLALLPAQQFESFPGLGVRARVEGMLVEVGNQRFLPSSAGLPIAESLEKDGKTLLFIAIEGELRGLIAARDRLRPEVLEAFEQIRVLGIQTIEILSGDHERAAEALAQSLRVPARANLLPQDKIEIVKRYQQAGQKVIMVGDGVNDAPALAQADVGIAMAGAGSDLAIEAAHIALLREDWRLIPELLRTARRTMRVVRMNLLFTALYNLIGISLAALGLLPPTVAAAAQSLPDLGILANSARLIRQTTSEEQNARRE